MAEVWTLITLPVLINNISFRSWAWVYWYDWWKIFLIPSRLLVRFLKQFFKENQVCADGFTFFRNLVEFLNQFSMRKKLRIKFLTMDLPSGILVKFWCDFLREKSCASSFWMDLPSGSLVKFLKRFSTRKKLRIKVLDGSTFWNFGRIFEAIFYKKKVAHQVFGWIYPSGILFEFLKRFSMWKKAARQFKMKKYKYIFRNIQISFLCKLKLSVFSFNIFNFCWILTSPSDLSSSVQFSLY